jgi:replicative DNA helicase
MEDLQNVQSDDFKNTHEIINGTEAGIIYAMSNLGDTALIGLDTGYYELNKMTDGLKKGRVTVIAARPSMGSTALALNIANSLLQKESGVAIFSFEMSAEDMMLRLISTRTSISLQKLRLGKIDSEQFKLINSAMEIMKKGCEKLFIYDQGSIDVNQICTKLRKLKSQNPDLDLVIIDSLQMIKISAGETVSEISSKLKVLARELDIAIVILSKLYSKLEWRINNRPILSDIPEYDLIEPHVDTILLIYRNDLYAYNEEKAREEKAIAAGKEFISRYVEKLEDEAEIIVAKQRNGSIGHIKLLFQQEFTRFIDRCTFDNIQIVDTSVNIAN